ncbi:hypothetical protein [Streptomyces sp. MUSC 14]|uniref:hypothetical protein n=1 Tax=Streptomyces sp. MUSC 14 TaxID=1354889 RepID=UPI0015A61672|nr:hypothetical protein [Streptomyces sp. MUSC 14]
MCELDEQQAKELAKLPPRVLGGRGGPAARKEARKVLEHLALISRKEREPRRKEGTGG